jgi:hypothetical protein
VVKKRFLKFKFKKWIVEAANGRIMLKERVGSFGSGARYAQIFSRKAVPAMVRPD